MKSYFAFVLILAILVAGGLAFAGDGTQEGAVVPTYLPPLGSASVNPSDEVYVLNPFESVSLSANQVWTDNRHRAYWNSSTGNINGFALFDVTQIPDNSLIVSMSLRFYLENAFGSPSNNPVVDLYWSDDDNWTRMTVAPGQLSLNDLLVDNIPFTSYIPSYDFIINVSAHNWQIDLLDNRLCIGCTNDVTYYSYVYFFGAYGTPTGPPPELTIVTSPGTPQNVNITLTPLNPPIIIPANGGTFSYTVNIVNNDPNTANFNAWIMATLPDSSVYGPIILRTLTLTPGASLTRTMSQSVPALAPPGNYTYTGYVGIYPNIIWSSSGFPFTKSATTDGSAPVMGEWELTGWDEESAEAVIPQSPFLFTTYPNPFNAVANIVFNLETAGNVELVVYDVNGREVAVLAEGYFNAGSQQFRFNGEALSSGIYFARLKANGDIHTRKLLLVK